MLLYFKDLIKFPNCLHSISSRHLELLLMRARPKSPTYPQDCTIFFTLLSNVYTKIKIRCCYLMIKSPCHKVANFTSNYFNKAIWGEHWEEDFGPLFPEQCFQLSSVNTTQTEGNYILGSGRGLQPNRPAFQQDFNLNQSVFETYQHGVYWLRPRRVYWTTNWYLK